MKICPRCLGTPLNHKSHNNLSTLQNCFIIMTKEIKQRVIGLLVTIAICTIPFVGLVQSIPFIIIIGNAGMLLFLFLILHAGDEYDAGFWPLVVLLLTFLVELAWAIMA